LYGSHGKPQELHPPRPVACWLSSSNEHAFYVLGKDGAAFEYGASGQLLHAHAGAVPADALLPEALPQGPEGPQLFRDGTDMVLVSRNLVKFLPDKGDAFPLPTPRLAGLPAQSLPGGGFLVESQEGSNRTFLVIRNRAIVARIPFAQGTAPATDAGPALIARQLYGEGRSQLLWFDRSGKLARVGAQHTGAIGPAVLLPGGRRAVYTLESTGQGGGELHFLDF
jgi:hypothetical protein